MLIDKLVIMPERVLNEEENATSFSRKLRVREVVDIHTGTRLVEASVNGTERNKYRFFVFEGCEGIMFKCHKAARDAEPGDHSVESIELNPSHRCFGGNLHLFIHRAGVLLNPSVIEFGRLIRIDYALNVAFDMDTVVKGLSFEGRSVHRQMYTPRRVEELMIGSRPSTTLAVYDYNKRHQIEGQVTPVTRLEIRLFESKVPPHLRRLGELTRLTEHVRSIAAGVYNPFRDVQLRVGFSFPEIDTPAVPASGRVTREYQRAWMDTCMAMNAQAAVQTLLSTTSYARAKHKALQTGSGLRATWSSMTERRYDLNSHLVQAAQEFIRPLVRPRPRPVPVPLQLAA